MLKLLLSRLWMENVFASLLPLWSTHEFLSLSTVRKKTICYKNNDNQGPVARLKIHNAPTIVEKKTLKITKTKMNFLKKKVFGRLNNEPRWLISRRWGETKCWSFAGSKGKFL